MALTQFERLVMSASYVQVKYDAKHGEFRMHWFLDKPDTNVRMSVSKAWSDLLSRSSSTSVLDDIARTMLLEIYEKHVNDANEEVKHADSPGDHPQDPDAESV